MNYSNVPEGVETLPEVNAIVDQLGTVESFHVEVKDRKFLSNLCREMRAVAACFGSVSGGSRHDRSRRRLRAPAHKRPYGKLVEKATGG